jgi:hypothetical protein
MCHLDKFHAEGSLKLYKHAILVVLLLLVLGGCGSHSANVAGTWSDGAGGTFEFLADNSLIIKDSPEDQKPVKGQWTAYADGRVRIDIFTPAGHKIATVAYVQDNDNMVMELRNKPYALARVKKK